MKKSNNKPELRFLGNTDEWEQCKLENICEYKSSALTAKDVDVDGKYDLYDANSLIGTTNKGFMDEDYITIIKDGAGVGRTRILPKNSMFLGTMGALTSKNSDLEFLYQLITKADLGKTYTGSTIPHIYFKDYGKNVYYVPCIEEQVKIGAYFERIDNLITLHQCKYDKLKNIKKSMLQKMFPQSGSLFPEFRFEGFTDAWEQRKVGDILSDVERPIVMQDDETYQLVTVKRRNEGIVSRGYFKGKDILVKNYYRIHEGDFLISKRQVIHGANGYVPISLDNAVVSNEYMVAVSNEDISSAFWTLMSQRKEMYQMYLFSSYGVDVEKMVFNVDDWKKRNVIIPKIEEQAVLVSFFSKLDDLITLHQRKIEKLINIKKACLDKMFV